MKSPKSFNKLLLLLILVVIISSLFGGFLFWRNLDNLSKKVSEKEVTIVNFAEKERALENLSKNYSNVEGKLNEINYAIPTQKEAASLLASIETLANSRGLSVDIYEHKTADKKAKKTTLASEATGVDKDENKEKEKANTFMYQAEADGDLMKFNPRVEVAGSYDKVQEFVKEIEGLNRLLVVNQLEILKEENPSAPDFVRTTISLSAYFKK